MKILYILSSTYYSGSTLSFLTLLKGVKEKGAQPIVLIPNKKGVLPNELSTLGVRYYVVENTFFSYPALTTLSDKFKSLYRIPKLLFNTFFSVLKVIKIAKKENIELIHTNVGPVVIGHYAARFLRKPHVWHIREYGDLDFNIKMFPSRAFFMSLLKKDNVITITKGLREYNNLTTSENTRVIYNGVRYRDEVYSNINRNDEFLVASRVSREKGHDLIIRSFAVFLKSYPNYRLTILGSGSESYIKELELLCKELKISENVDFVGYTTNVTEYMIRSKALLVASPAEGFGRMTAEACFAGCLVIGYNRAGTKEIFEKIEGFPFENEQQFIMCMEKVADLSDEEYKVMSSNAQMIAVNLFSIESYVSNVIDFYNSILVS